MTSPCAEYWQLFLAQGLCTGIGNGLVFCSTLAILPTYFKRYRAIALGISASGTATGGMVIPAIIEALLPRIGFPWTVRVLGFLFLGLQIDRSGILEDPSPATEKWTNRRMGGIQRTLLCPVLGRSLLLVLGDISGLLVYKRVRKDSGNLTEQCFQPADHHECSWLVRSPDSSMVHGQVYWCNEYDDSVRGALVSLALLLGAHHH